MGIKKETSNLVSSARDFVLRVIEGEDTGMIFALSNFSVFTLNWMEQNWPR